MSNETKDCLKFILLVAVLVAVFATGITIVFGKGAWKTHDTFGYKSPLQQSFDSLIFPTE
jgi:hypothetical protein